MSEEALDYYHKTRLPRFKVGDQVFAYLPAAKACKAYKFARSFYGPYRIVGQSETGVVVRPVDRHKQTLLGQDSTLY